MTRNVRSNATPADATRWAGGLLAAGCLLVVAAIGMHLASGAPKMVGAPMEDAAAVLADGEVGFTTVGLLSIPANLAVIVAGLMLASSRPHATARVPAAALWYTLSVGYLLALLYDMALPYLLVPLAGSYAENSLIFEGLYRTFDMAHSAGLLFAFVAVALLFVQEAARRDRALPRPWAFVAAATAVLGAVLMGSFLAGRPLVFLGPAAMVTWASLAALGVRIAWPRATPSTIRADDAASQA